MMTKDSGNVQTRAMLVALNVSTWTARRYDRVVSDQVTTVAGARSDAGRFNKHLLGTTDTSLRPVIAAASAARTTHYNMTLPWTDEGMRLLPTANYFPYTDAMRKARSVYDVAVATFVDDYPQLIEQARAHLGALFDEKAYHNKAWIAGRFGMSTAFSPMPSAGDFRLSLPAEQIADLEESVEKRIEEAVRVAHESVWQRLYDSVARIHARVADPEVDAQTPRGAAKRGAIREALIENATETATLLGRLNVVNDTDFDDMRESVLRAVSTLDAQALRDDAAARVQVAQQTDDVLRAMEMFFTPQQPNEEAA